MGIDDASSWSKDRIREEIADRRSQIRQIREDLQYYSDKYAANGYRDAEPGWYDGDERMIADLESEIARLKSLL